MTTSAVAPRSITRDEFRSISEFLHRRTGIRLVHGKEPLVMGRLEMRLRRLGLASYGEYVRLLTMPEHDAEARLATDLLTTNETFFFREPQHFDFLRRVVTPEHRSSRPFRLWSAASSSGEEAYTAAMVLAEALPDQPWEVVGSDVSSRVVETAQRGVYPIGAADRIPTPMLRRHCRKGRDEYAGTMAISRELRARVTFLCANLLDDLTRFGRFDVILLRNVMIYFDIETKKGLVPRLEQMLHPGGYLVVSLSESLNGIPCRLRMVEPSVYRLGDDRG
jgi:chemotaxis protein methyltransferase CheR